MGVGKIRLDIWREVNIGGFKFYGEEFGGFEGKEKLFRGKMGWVYVLLGIKG